MFGIDEYSLNFIGKLQDEGSIRKSICTIEDLSDYEREKLARETAEHLESSYNTFESASRTILNQVDYKNCFRVDMNLLGDHDDRYYQ